MEIDYKQKIAEAMLGVAVGDALGVPVEFYPRERRDERPVTGMMGGGTFGLPAGYWSDDTSLTLVLVDALSKSTDQPNYTRFMTNAVSWLKDGEFTPGGTAFDVGRTCLKAIGNYVKGNDPLLCGPNGERENGNGALMRIIPALFWCEAKYGEDFFDNPEARGDIHNFTALTHAHARCKIASGLYLSVGAEILRGKTLKDAIRDGLDKAYNFYKSSPEYAEELPNYDRLVSEDFASTPRDDIKSTGYVVDTLEAAIWSLLNTDNYKDCMLKAVNLGYDTDSVAAVAGGLAGIYYGLGGATGIPLDWLGTLKKLEYIKALSDKMAENLE